MLICPLIECCLWRLVFETGVQASQVVPKLDVPSDVCAGVFSCRVCGPVDPRRVSAGLRPYEVRARLARFYDLVAHADVPELERLAGTVETWWPAIGVTITVQSRPSPSTAKSLRTRSA